MMPIHLVRQIQDEATFVTAQPALFLVQYPTANKMSMKFPFPFGFQENFGLNDQVVHSAGKQNQWSQPQHTHVTTEPTHAPADTHTQPWSTPSGPRINPPFIPSVKRLLKLKNEARRRPNQNNTGRAREHQFFTTQRSNKRRTGFKPVKVVTPSTTPCRRRFNQNVNKKCKHWRDGRRPKCCTQRVSVSPLHASPLGACVVS